MYGLAFLSACVDMIPSVWTSTECVDCYRVCGILLSVWTTTECVDFDRKCSLRILDEFAAHKGFAPFAQHLPQLSEELHCAHLNSAISYFICSFKL